MSDGFVYFIKSPSLNAVKVGFTAGDPRARLKKLQVGSADDLELIGWADGTMADEKKWHLRYNSYRVRGEWFRLEGEFEDFIRAFIEHYWIPVGRELSS